MLSIKGVELKQANKIYIRKNYTLNYKFAAMTKDIFDSDVQNIDLYQPEKAANEINEWVNINKVFILYIYYLLVCIVLESAP